MQTITVEDSVAPVVTCPADTTIECDASTAPNDLNVGLEFPFDANPTLGATQAPGVWYTDRYAPFGFASAFFDGDNRLKHSINLNDCSPCRGGQSSSFYDTQGRKYDLPAETTRMSIDLYIPADWATTERRMAGFWGTAVDSGNAISGFPIIEFTSTTDDSGVPRFRGWTSAGSGGWIDMGLPTGFVYDAWYTLEIELVGASWVFRVGDLELLTPGLGSVRIDNVILQGHNNTAGVTYDIYWDNYLAAGGVQAIDNCDSAPTISFSDSSAAGACPQESTITRTWMATDCAGNSSTCDQIIDLVDTTAPVIGACPDDITVNADAGDCDAVVTFTPPTATDNCDGAPTVVCDWPSGSTFPSGTTLVTCTATDGCSNSSACDFNVTVNSSNDLTVAVELDPAVSMPASVTRCITFELWECPGGAPAATVTADMVFMNGLASDTIDIPCGNYTCITARDELHTLRRTDLDDFGISGTEYVADFTANGATDDDSLIGGNLNDDFFIDILDFGTFSAQWATTPSPDTPCPVGGAHADINSDAIVDNNDFSFIQNNFLATHEANCCGALNREAGGFDGPVTDISIAELRRRGLGHLAVSDLNHDGRLNMDDVVEFANGARPQKLQPDHVDLKDAQPQGVRRPDR
ncbi:MAG: HYR domain-containing protein [Phycisphaerae bacterium]